MNKKRFAVLVASAAVVAGSIVGMAAPAQAAPPNCIESTACQFRSSGWGGGYFNFYYSIPNESAYKFAPGGLFNVDQNISSVYNNGQQQRVYFYKGYNFSGGTPISFGLHEYNSNLAGLTGWNDQISSACFANYC